MSMNPAASPQAPPPDIQMMQLLFGKMVFSSVTAIARLGVPDYIGETPRDVEDIARESSTDAPSLYRVLRLLASIGLFTEAPARHFAITPFGAVLRSDHPRSMRDLAIMFSDPWQVEAYSRMTDCIRTGTDGVTLAHGMHAFDYFQHHPDQAANFHRSMTGFSAASTHAILQLADFSGFNRIADCGGGHGFLLSRILDKFPNLHGVLFDLPEVVSGAPATGHFQHSEGRIAFEFGSFFDRVPDECDAYIMKHIVHDWDDESSRRVLSLMREQLQKTAPETGRIFLCEMVVPETPEPGPAKMLDIEMLVCTSGGKERTAAEFAQLFESAGLRLVSITPTESPVCLIEAAL